MKKRPSLKPLVLCCASGLTAVIVPLPVSAADSDWQVSFSYDALFNVSAKFTGHPTALGLVNPQDQPGAQNYDNGYVGTDISGSTTQSTYWGYSQTSQLVTSGGNATGVNYQQTAVSPGQTSPNLGADPGSGGDLRLRRALTRWGKVTLGLELGGSYNRVDLKDTSDYLADGLRSSYAYNLTTPFPGVLLPPGYAGPYSGAGPTVNLPGMPGATTAIPGAVLVSGTREIEADLFGFRLGPYLELPVTRKFDLSASVGALVMVVRDRVNWNETVTVNTATTSGYWTGSGSVSGNNCGVTAGFYAGLDAAYKLTHDWDLTGGVKFEDAGTYSHNIGQGRMDLNLGQAVSLNLGLSYNF